MKSCVVHTPIVLGNAKERTLRLRAEIGIYWSFGGCLKKWEKERFVFCAGIFNLREPEHHFLMPSMRSWWHFSDGVIVSGSLGFDAAKERLPRRAGNPQYQSLASMPIVFHTFISSW